MRKGAILAALAAFSVGTAGAGDQAAAQSGESSGVHQARYVDPARSIPATMGFAGSSDRRVDVTIWHPAGRVTEARPLVIYGHGTNGRANNAMHIVRALVDAGYVVAAPDFPLSSSAAWTAIKSTDVRDLANQTGDVRFIIDRLIADPATAPMIDAARIGYIGHSLGAVTGYFLGRGGKLRDPRIKAFVLMGAGDPVQTALSNPMGLNGTPHLEVPVPTLFLTAEKDIFARTTGRPFAAYSRIEPPRYEVLIRGGAHVWFRDGNEWPEGNRNPDCLWFEKAIPGVNMPGCDERVPLIGPAEQQRLTRTAILAFFDGWLRNDGAALKRLRGIVGSEPAVELRLEDASPGGAGR